MFDPCYYKSLVVLKILILYLQPSYKEYLVIKKIMHKKMYKRCLKISYISSNKKPSMWLYLLLWSFHSIVRLSSVRLYFLLTVVVAIYGCACPRSFFIGEKYYIQHVTCRLHTFCHFAFQATCHLSFAFHTTHQIFNKSLVSHTKWHLSFACCHVHHFATLHFMQHVKHESYHLLFAFHTAH
jgi:hypothetical protein